MLHNFNVFLDLKKNWNFTRIFFSKVALILVLITSKIRKLIPKNSNKAYTWREKLKTVAAHYIYIFTVIMAFLNIPHTEYDRFKHILKSYYQNGTIKREQECDIWKGYTERNGYGRICLTLNQIEGSTVSRQVLSHRFVFLVHNKNYNMHDNDDFELSVSHICGNKRCMRIDHLYLEPLEVNKSRIKCHKERKCSRNHEPECLMV